MLVAGTWLGPQASHTEYVVGSVGAERPRGTITPRLSEIEDWVRLRAKVDERECLFFINGRLIHREPLTIDHDPWLAVRVPFHSFGQIRDVSVTGEPVVPRTLNLSSNGQLPGWTSYYGGTIGRPHDSDWWHETDSAGSGVIVGRLELPQVGTGKESLFRYQRPVIEDAVIDYECFYEPGRMLVHPAIGRRTLLLTPEGVRVHWITNAHFESEGADPFNAGRPVLRNANAPLPLEVGAWNHVQLRFRGDTVSLRLNQQPVYEERLDSRNDRTFGLFHYADVTEARVGNIRWTGDWPRELPPPPQQELRDTTTHRLDQKLPQLTDVFEHNLISDGLPRDIFTIGQATEESVSIVSSGLRVEGEKRDTGYSQVNVGTFLGIEGDFDITATFHGLEFSATAHDKCDAILQVALSDKDLSHHAVGRSLVADPGKVPRDVVEHQLVQFAPLRIQMVDRRAEEFNSGRLRLARRGSRIYSLFAAGDSDNFRLVHVRDTVADTTQVNGVRLIAGMNSSLKQDSCVSVVWEKLLVRAEKLTGQAVAK